MFETPTVKFEGIVYYQNECRNYCWFLTGIDLLTLIALGVFMLTGRMEKGMLMAFVLLAISLIVLPILAIGYSRFKIEMKDTYLIATPMFGRKRTVEYNQISRIRYGFGPAKTLVFMVGNKRLISIDNYAVGYMELREMFQENGMLR